MCVLARVVEGDAHGGSDFRHVAVGGFLDECSVFIDEEFVAHSAVLHILGIIIEEDISSLAIVNITQQMVETVVEGLASLRVRIEVIGTIVQHLAVFSSQITQAVVLREGQHGQIAVEGLSERTVPCGQARRFALDATISHPLVQHAQQTVPNNRVAIEVFVCGLHITDSLVILSGNLVVAIHIADFLDALHSAIGAILLKG